jgi:hypothetical protein
MVAKGWASLVAVTEGEGVEAADLGPQGVVVDPAEAVCEKEDTAHIPAMPFFLASFEILPECVIALPVRILCDPQYFALGEPGQIVLAAPSAAGAQERYNDVIITKFDLREKKAPAFHGSAPFAVELLSGVPWPRYRSVQPLYDPGPAGSSIRQGRFLAIQEKKRSGVVLRGIARWRAGVKMVFVRFVSMLSLPAMRNKGFSRLRAAVRGAKKSS